MEHPSELDGLLTEETRERLIRVAGIVIDMNRLGDLDRPTSTMVRLAKVHDHGTVLEGDYAVSVSARDDAVSVGYLMLGGEQSISGRNFSTTDAVASEADGQLVVADLESFIQARFEATGIVYAPDLVAQTAVAA
jgi:hypothetical protein